jgi:hypothetical protein
MKSIKKFSAMTAKDQPITESAKVTKEAVDELIKKIGFDSIEELKKEKDLLSKLEAMSKTFAKSNDISEDEIEEDRADDIEDEIKAKGSPKSLEGTEGKGSDEEVVDAEVEEVEEEVEDDLVSDEQEITKEVPAEADEVEDEDGVDVASEEKETPKATRRIMAFEDFIKEKEETINKNISYHDDDEEPEDYAVPVAASADPLAEGAEAKGKEDEKEGDELEDKGDKKVDSEDDKEKADHYKGAVKSDDAQIKSLKKDAKFDKEEEEDAEKNESTIMDFASFVNEAYDKVVFGGNKGDKSKTKEDEEDFEDEDKTDEKFDDVVLGGNKGDKSKTKEGEEDYEDEDKKDEAYDVVTLGGNKGDKSKTKKGEEDYEDDKDESVEEDRAEDIEDEINAKGKTKKLTKSVKEGVAEVITKIEGDEIADEEAGADGIAIPAMKGDGSETAAGIAADIMNKGKVKNLSALAGKLVTPDQKVTEVIPDEANDVSEDGIEIPLVKEEVLADDSIAEKFRKIAINKLGKVNEADITSDDQFKEYAMKMLKDAFGADFDETKATEVADGLISKYGEDYGAMVGALQSTMGS